MPLHELAQVEALFLDLGRDLSHLCFKKLVVKLAGVYPASHRSQLGEAGTSTEELISSGGS